MSYTYASWVTAAADMLAMDEANADYVGILSSAIDYAEQRMYRELDLLSTVVRDTSGTVTANARSFTLPQTLGRFVTTQGINIFTPVGTQTTRNQLVPVSRDFLDLTWPTNTAASVTTVPQYYAMISDQTVIFGPPPGDGFTAEVIGTIRPTALSSSNTTSYLTLYLPDLWLAATMIFFAGWQKNFGAQADDVRSAQSWEAQYDKLLLSANVEEQRKRYASSGWAAYAPTPLVSNPRS